MLYLTPPLFYDKDGKQNCGVVSQEGTLSQRPTGTYPYVVLYTATDNNGETYRLEANTDGSVSSNWTTIGSGGSGGLVVFNTPIYTTSQPDTSEGGYNAYSVSITVATPSAQVGSYAIATIIYGLNESEPRTTYIAFGVIQSISGSTANFETSYVVAMDQHQYLHRIYISMPQEYMCFDIVCQKPSVFTSVSEVATEMLSAYGTMWVSASGTCILGNDRLVINAIAGKNTSTLSLLCLNPTKATVNNEYDIIRDLSQQTEQSITDRVRRL